MLFFVGMKNGLKADFVFLLPEYTTDFAESG
jgi:hypothetical protein